MATDITGIWDFIWSGDPDIMKQHAFTPVSIPDFSTIRVCFVFVEGDRYRGRYYDPELPQRSYPNWPYDSTFDVQVLSSSTPGQQYDTVSMVMLYRSSEDVPPYDAYEAIAGQVRTDYPEEPAPIMFGLLYGNNGDFAVWKMTKNVSLEGCPESLFEG
jgi:hypothetical protein